jgi:SAM-dependent methyltransferase
MHYTINNIVIKSENTAKSSKQKNQIIVDYINRMKSCDSILDYGCGKCRYTRLLSPKAKDIFLLDSQIQIKRKQIIEGQYTTVLEYANEFSNVCVISAEDFQHINRLFDFILCTNVLSAVPCIEERKRILINIRRSLSKKGIALISVQYRNSYFNTYVENKDNIPYEDGWIIKKGNGYSFYGMIYPDALCSLCEESGLNVVDQFNNDGSTYVFVNK